MRQKFTMNAEFLLPENFSGGFKEALQLYYDYCMQKWDNNIKYPATLPEELCFDWTVQKGGVAYTSFAIESFRTLDIEDIIDAEEEEQERWENDLCSESSQ